MVPWARAGVGAVATQANGRAAYGPAGLNRMAAGLCATDALAESLAEDDQPDVRQVAMIDAAGRVAGHTGDGCGPNASYHLEDGIGAQANMVASPAIAAAMAAAFRAADGDLALRLIAALDAAEALGGDLRGRQSAAILIAGADPVPPGETGVLLDLRVDDDPEPLVRLRRAVQLARAFQPMWQQIRGPACRGPLAPTAEQSAAAIATLIEAQEVYGPGNREPDFWRAVALWRSGQEDRAGTLIDELTAGNPGWRELFRHVTARRPAS
jgi:hypothetical protein